MFCQSINILEDKLPELVDWCRTSQLIQEFIGVVIDGFAAIAEKDFANYRILIDDINYHLAKWWVKLIDNSQDTEIRIINKILINSHQMLRLVDYDWSSNHIWNSKWIILFYSVFTNFLSNSTQVIFYATKDFEVCILYHILDSKMEIVVCL